MKYVKKPIVVEAYRTNVEVVIETLEGVMHADAGDYIITGINGEQYPCKPDIFEKHTNLTRKLQMCSGRMPFNKNVTRKINRLFNRGIEYRLDISFLFLF